MNKESCRNRKFWISKYCIDDLEDDIRRDLVNDDELEDMLAKKVFGVCRRYPPVAVTHEDCGGFYGFRGDATDYFEFVHTEIGDWCGEFLPSNETK